MAGIRRRRRARAGRASSTLSPAAGAPCGAAQRRRLDRASRPGPRASVDDRVAYHEHKAALLSRIAADLGTAEAHEVAAQAWEYAASLCRTADTATEVGR